MLPTFFVYIRYSALILLCWVLIMLSMHDIRTHLLPNRMVACAAVLSAAVSCIDRWAALAGLPALSAEIAELSAGSWQHLLSVLMRSGAALLWGAGSALLPAVMIQLFWRLLLHRTETGMGGGDIKLLAALGLGLGIHGLFLLPIASLLSLPQAVWTQRSSQQTGGLQQLSADTAQPKRQGHFAFGPYLCIAAIALHIMVLR